MSLHEDLPGTISRNKFINALQRLGFKISTKGGKGSHFKATWRNEKSITIQSDLRKDVLRYVLKQIEACSGITWEQIRKKM